MAFLSNGFFWNAFKIRPNQGKDISVSTIDFAGFPLQGKGTTNVLTYFADGAILDAVNDTYVRVVENPATKSRGLTS